MKRYIEGEDRSQATLLPACLDDYIAEDNPVRAVDAFVEELDLQALGFAGAEPAETGRPAYHPAVLLKLYIYGYLNRVPSSRRLEREAQRNVELMWLTGRLAPDFKTIADFRRGNGGGIRNVCRRFVQLRRAEALHPAPPSTAASSRRSTAAIAITRKVDKRQEQIEESIQRYLTALETADRTQPAEVEAKTERLREKIETLRGQMRRMDAIREQLKSAPDEQISETDPDARSMISQAKGTGVVGYNVQAAVDTKQHLIVTHEVTNAGSDRAQLSKMATAARDEIGNIADRGYFEQ
jgi:transposase